MIRREFLKKAVIAALTIATGTVAVPKVAATQKVYKKDVLWVVDWLVKDHNRGNLEDITFVKTFKHGKLTEHNFRTLGKITPLTVGLNCLDFRDVVNLLFEKTGVAYGIYVQVHYDDYKSYQNIVYNYKNIPKVTDKSCIVDLVFRHGQKEEMIMFTGPWHIYNGI